MRNRVIFLSACLLAVALTAPVANADHVCEPSLEEIQRTIRDLVWCGHGYESPRQVLDGVVGGQSLSALA